MLQAACLGLIRDPNMRSLICATCLSKNRVLHSLEVLPHLLSICNAIAGITLTMQDNICWECKAQLLKMLKFREKAVRSQCMLTSLSQLIQEPRSGQEGGIVESLSTLSRNEPLYYEVGVSISAQEQTAQFLVKATEDMMEDNTRPAIFTVEMETAKNLVLEEYDESESVPRPLKLDPDFDNEGSGLETQAEDGVEGITLNTLDEEQKIQESACVPVPFKSEIASESEQSSSVDSDSDSSDREATDNDNVEGTTNNSSDEGEMMKMIKFQQRYGESEFVPRPLKLDPDFDNEGSGLETQAKDDVEGITRNTLDEEQKIQESACVPVPFKSELASESEQSSSVDSDSDRRHYDREATDKDNVDETIHNSSDEVEMMKMIKSQQRDTQDYLDIADVFSNSAALDEPSVLEFIKEEPIDPVDAENLDETEEIGQCILNKIHRTNDGLTTEEETNADIRMSTETADSSPAGDIRVEPSRSLELEKLKEQLASWRVILHRLPTDTLPPSTTTSGGALKMITAAGYGEQESYGKTHKIGLDKSTNKVDGTSATYSYHVDQLIATSKANKKKYKSALIPITIQTNFELNASENFICEHCRKSFVTKLKLRQHISTHNWRLQIESMATGSSRLKIHRIGTKTQGEKPYKCKTCDFRTTHSRNLKRHMQTHTGEKPYKCNSCGYKSAQSSTLKEHIRSHTGEKPYKCETCDYMSTTSSRMKKHSRTHTGDKPYKCKTCDYKSVHASTLKEHIRSHTGEKPYKCETCDYKSTTSSRMKKHLRTHTGEKPYKCKTCDYKSVHSGTLKKHIRTHTGEKPYKCETCDYKSTTSSRMKKHMQTHTGEKPYKCKTCDFKCTQLSNLQTHMLTHTGEKPFKCKTCDFKSAKSSDLKRHMLTHTGEKPYKCNSCGYKSAQSFTLKEHIRTHTGEKPYKCETCDYKTTTSSNLKIHLRTHTGVKSYKCKMCDYKSARSSTLQEHIRSHTGEKPYKCETCDYKSTTSSGMKKHLRTHTGEKSYKCNMCDFKSSTSGNLKRHILIHTGEKPYKCKTCDYKSARSCHLKVHIRSHTGGKP